MDTKVILIGAGLVALGGGIWYITHKNRQNTNRSNQATQDASDPAVQLANEWYSALNVSRRYVGDNFTAGWSLYVSQAEINRIYNVALKTYNWANVQKVFSAKCNGNYTIGEAMQTAIGTKEPTAYKNAQNYIGMKKVITTQATVKINCDKTGKLPTPSTASTVQKNVCIGAFIDEKKITRNGETQPCYIVLTEVTGNGTLNYVAIPKIHSKLV